MLLARIYEVLPLPCPRCGETMRLIAFITDVGCIQRILEHIDEPTYAPLIAPAARYPPQREQHLDAREVDTFALNERAASEQQHVAGQSRDGCFTLVSAFPLRTFLPVKVI